MSEEAAAVRHVIVSHNENENDRDPISATIYPVETN